MKRGGSLRRLTPLRRTGFVRGDGSARGGCGPVPAVAPGTTSDRSPRTTGLRRESPKRAGELREYRKLKKAFLKGRETCEFPTGCIARTTVVHHRRGRFGARLNDVDWWAASCDFHNDFAETQTGEALRIGWLVRIESVA